MSAIAHLIQGDALHYSEASLLSDLCFIHFIAVDKMHVVNSVSLTTLKQLTCHRLKLLILIDLI